MDSSQRRWIKLRASRDEAREPIEPLPNDARAALEEVDHEMIRAFTLFGIYALAARGHLKAVPVQQWRRDAQARGVENAIGALLTTIEALFVGDSGDGWRGNHARPTNPSARQNSLLTGKFTGNFTKIGTFGETLPVRTQQNQLVADNSLQNETRN
jgi:hypothetical protein